MTTPGIDHLARGLAVEQRRAGLAGTHRALLRAAAGLAGGLVSTYVGFRRAAGQGVPPPPPSGTSWPFCAPEQPSYCVAALVVDDQDQLAAAISVLEGGVAIQIADLTFSSPTTSIGKRNGGKCSKRCRNGQVCKNGRCVKKGKGKKH